MSITSTVPRARVNSVSATQFQSKPCKQRWVDTRTQRVVRTWTDFSGRCDRSGLRYIARQWCDSHRHPAHHHGTDGEPSYRGVSEGNARSRSSIRELKSCQRLSSVARSPRISASVERSRRSRSACCASSFRMSAAMYSTCFSWPGGMPPRRIESSVCASPASVPCRSSIALARSAPACLCSKPIVPPGLLGPSETAQQGRASTLPE